MNTWIIEHHLISENGRKVCTVYFDEEAKCWDFVDFNDHCDGGFATAEEAITYCNEYMRNTYGI